MRLCPEVPKGGMLTRVVAPVSLAKLPAYTPRMVCHLPPDDSMSLDFLLPVSPVRTKPRQCEKKSTDCGPST